MNTVISRATSIAGLIIITILLSSCSHNIVQYSKGIGMDIGINPQTYMVSVNLKYGQITTMAVKEKATVDYKGQTTTTTDATQPASTTITTGSQIRLQTRDQITGNMVDLQKVRRGK